MGPRQQSLYLTPHIADLDINAKKIYCAAVIQTNTTRNIVRRRYSTSTGQPNSRVENINNFSLNAVERTNSKRKTPNNENEFLELHKRCPFICAEHTRIVLLGPKIAIVRKFHGCRSKGII